jgi:hypothetical protein
MQARPDGVHLYHSVKGSNIAPGSGIRHRMSNECATGPITINLSRA